MILRRVTGVASTVLLVLLSVAIAEAVLFVLVLVFSSILQLQLSIQVGERFLQLWMQQRPMPYLATPNVIVERGGVIVSILFTFGCGAGAAAWRFGRWRPL